MWQSTSRSTVARLWTGMFRKGHAWYISSSRRIQMGGKCHLTLVKLLTAPGSFPEQNILASESLGWEDVVRFIWGRESLLLFIRWRHWCLKKLTDFYRHPICRRRLTQVPSLSVSALLLFRHWVDFGGHAVLSREHQPGLQLWLAFASRVLFEF